MDRLRLKLNFDQSLTVDNRGILGGLCVLWKEEINLSLRSYSQNHIDFDVGIPGDSSYWRLTVFYGFPATSDRHISWRLLESLYGTDSIPWLCIGDFNEILQANEQEGGNVRQDRQMEGFRLVMEHCNFIDLGYSRNKFTWLTTKGGGIKVRLDRALGNQEWMEKFPRYTVKHLNKTSSDHVPVLINWSGRFPISGKKQFRYEECWHMQEGCAEVVREGWEYVVDGSPMFQITEKIKMTRMKLNNWARSNAKSGPSEIREVEDKLTSLLEHPFSWTAKKEGT